jgi:DNA-directed RNA polymerase sigma subunit (sigma70/sigma32)
MTHTTLANTRFGALILRAKKGNPSAKRALYRLLVPAIVKKAKTYLEHLPDGSFELKDLKQEAWFGVQKAIDKFDPNYAGKGFVGTHSLASLFAGMAHRWVFDAMQQAADRDHHLIHIPKNIFKARKKAQARGEVYDPGLIYEHQVTTLPESPDAKFVSDTDLPFLEYDLQRFGLLSKLRDNELDRDFWFQGLNFAERTVIQALYYAEDATNVNRASIFRELSKDLQTTRSRVEDIALAAERKIYKAFRHEWDMEDSLPLAA